MEKFSDTFGVPVVGGLGLTDANTGRNTGNYVWVYPVVRPSYGRLQDNPFFPGERPPEVISSSKPWRFWDWFWG
jgi:hypothetical protein